MVIRKYMAKTQEEAVRLAKEDLGESVVIMNTKQNSPKGLFRLFKTASVEITAAVDEEKEEKKKKESDSLDFTKIQEAIAETNSILAANERKEALEKEKLKSAAGARTDSFDAEEKNENAREKKEQKDADIEERLSTLQDLLERQMQSEKEQTEEKQEKEDTGKAYFDLIYRKLRDNEVEESYAKKLLDDIRENLGKNATLDSILAAVYQKIVLKIGQPHLIDLKGKKTKYFFFVGPTGVGKTTTIAKIASTLKLTKQTKVAMITSDTYRIAAVEQLKTYANILGVPLHVVYAAQDMEQAVEEFRDYDVVFVDTAGRSHNNREQREDIQKLLDAVPEENREVFLVLSATTKYKDLVNIAQTYAKMTKYSLIFTKLDETDAIGNIFNIHMLTGAPLSYTTWGQNVPDDIGKIDAQNMAKQLLGGNG